MNWHRDKVLFFTHNPGPWCEPGERWTRGPIPTRPNPGIPEKRGALPPRPVTYQITRVREVNGTALLAGGYAPCWEVRGRPA